MLNKLNSKNLFTVGNEDHTEETVKELDEQGVVEVADSEEVVAAAVPSEDVQEAGDDIGQATPVAEIGADDKEDITVAVTDETPLEGTTVIESSTDGSNAEVTELMNDGEQASAATAAIVSEATSELTGGTADTDVNGNTITPEQAAENAEEAAIEEEIDDEEEEEAVAKNIHQEAAEADENADEGLAEAINDDSTDGGVDAEATDDTSDGIDTEGGQGDLGISPDLGSDSNPEGGDDSEFDDTPLEGAEEPASEPPADEPVDEVSSDTSTEISEGDDLGDLAGDDVVPVDEEVEKQNEAADVTADAASADVNQTDFIEGDTPEQHGDEPETDIVPNDGEEIVAEAVPAIQNQEDVSTINSRDDIDEQTSVDEDDTPLDDVPLEVDAEQDLTPTEIDGTDGEDNTGATVEESITDQTAEDLQEGVDDVADATAEIEEDAGDGSEETVDESDTPASDEVVEETDVIDTEGGEVEETEEEADFDNGEIDIKDVDTDTTDEDVEEAMADAAEVGEWADEEDKEADIGDKTIEELQKEKEALETFRVMLEESIANEQYVPGILGFINESMEPVRKRFAEFDSTVGNKVALEDYAAGDMDLAYRASLESIRGLLSRITTVTHSITHQIEKWWSRGMIDKVLKRADALDKQIDLSLVKLKDADWSTGDVTGVRGYLATSETNLVKAVADDLKVTTDIAVKGIKASEQFQDNLVKGLNDIIGAGSKEAVDKVLDAIAKLKSTKDAFPRTAFDRGLLGGYKLEMRDQSGSDRTDKIEALGHNAIPVGVKSSNAGDGSTYKLSKGDIANLLKCAKTYVGIARKLANTTGDRAVNSVSKIRTTRDRALPIAADTRVKGDEYGVDATATAMKLAAKAHVDLYKFITKHCVEVADACCGVAKKVTK